MVEELKQYPVMIGEKLYTVKGKNETDAKYQAIKEFKMQFHVPKGVPQSMLLCKTHIVRTYEPTETAQQIAYAAAEFLSLKVTK